MAGGSWSTYIVSCFASQESTLHQDSDGTLWAGCGTATSGNVGVRRSSDGGQTWHAPTTNPSGIIDTFRVHDITRGHDGALYLAGTISQEGTQYRVIRLDTSTPEPYAASATLIGEPVVPLNSTIGHYAELPNGAALAVSQVGQAKLFRPSPSTGNMASSWTASTDIKQFTSLVTHNGQFYASGSQIGIPPRIFLPPTAPGAEPWELVEVVLDTSFDGEMWGIAVNDQRVVAVGINQDDNFGKIYVSNGDPYDPANFTVHEFRDGELRSWAHGVCMRGNLIAVVGRRLPSGARVLVSTNGGTSFTDVSPSGSAILSSCVIAPDGILTVMGSGGFIGVWDGMEITDQIFSDRFSGNVITFEKN
ncbi:MAG: hypothetical protein EA370_18060 [Wenzhouxiangella sp.]|nr:MAG: hypothetical protein EA370_18060 [Wenzhouxiangella sp.]